ncbi:MAG: response regulator [Actinomycetota bacterium]
MGATRVVVIDDHRSFAEAVQIALAIEEDLEPAGVAGSMKTGLDLVSETEPDVVLVDIHLPDGSGIEATRAIKARKPDTRVVVITGDVTPSLMAEAAKAGACGFLIKTAPISEVVGSIRTARDGGLMIEPDTLASILDQLAHSEKVSSNPHVRLTEREIQVLSLLAQGRDPSSIARTIGVTLHTARSHVKSILAKLNVHSQLEAVVKAARLGIIEPLGE